MPWGRCRLLCRDHGPPLARRVRLPPVARREHQGGSQGGDPRARVCRRCDVRASFGSALPSNSSPPLVVAVAAAHIKGACSCSCRRRSAAPRPAADAPRRCFRPRAAISASPRRDAPSDIVAGINHRCITVVSPADRPSASVTPTFGDVDLAPAATCSMVRVRVISLHRSAVDPSRAGSFRWAPAIWASRREIAAWRPSTRAVPRRGRAARGPGDEVDQREPQPRCVLSGQSDLRPQLYRGPNASTVR